MGGDKRKVGYYAGLIVSNAFSLFHPRSYKRHLGIFVLRHGSTNSPSVESYLGSCGPKACYVGRTIWFGDINARVRPFTHLLDSRRQVSYLLCTMYSRALIIFNFQVDAYAGF